MGDRRDARGRHGRDEYRARRRRSRSRTPASRIPVIEDLQTAIESVASYTEVLTAFMYQQENFENIPEALTSVLLPKLVRSAVSQKEIAAMKQLGDFQRMKSMLQRYFRTCPMSNLVSGMAHLMQIRDLDVVACGIMVDRCGRHLDELSGSELSQVVDITSMQCEFSENGWDLGLDQFLTQLQQNMRKREWTQYGDVLPKTVYCISMLDATFPLIPAAVTYIARNTTLFSPQHIAMVAHLCPEAYRDVLLDGLAESLVKMTTMRGPDVVMFCRLLGGRVGSKVDAAFTFICREVARCCVAWGITQVANSLIALEEQVENQAWLGDYSMMGKTTIPMLMPKVQQLPLQQLCKLIRISNLCAVDSKPFLLGAGQRIKTESIDQDTAKELIFACTRSKVMEESILQKAAELILPVSLVSLAEAAEITWGMAVGKSLKQRMFCDMVEPYLEEDVTPSIALHLTEAMRQSQFVNELVFHAVAKFLRTCDPVKNIVVIKNIAMIMRVDVPYCSTSNGPCVTSVDEWDGMMAPLKSTKGALRRVSGQCAKVVSDLSSEAMASLFLSFAFLRHCPETVYIAFAKEAVQRLTDVNFSSAALCDLLWAFAILLPKGTIIAEVVYEIFNHASSLLLQVVSSLTPFEAINALYAYEILRKRGSASSVQRGAAYQILLRPIIVHQHTLLDFHYEVLAQALLSWQQNPESLGIPFPQSLATEAMEKSYNRRRQYLPWRVNKEITDCAKAVGYETSVVTDTGLPVAFRSPAHDVCILLPRPWHYLDEDLLDGSVLFLSQLLTASELEVQFFPYLRWSTVPRQSESRRAFFLRVASGGEAVFRFPQVQPAEDYDGVPIEAPVQPELPVEEQPCAEEPIQEEEEEEEAEEVCETNEVPEQVSERPKKKRKRNSDLQTARGERKRRRRRASQDSSAAETHCYVDACEKESVARCGRVAVAYTNAAAMNSSSESEWVSEVNGTRRKLVPVSRRRVAERMQAKRIRAERRRARECDQEVRVKARGHAQDASDYDQDVKLRLVRVASERGRVWSKVKEGKRRVGLGFAQASDTESEMVLKKRVQRVAPGWVRVTRRRKVDGRVRTAIVREAVRDSSESASESDFGQREHLQPVRSHRQVARAVRRMPSLSEHREQVQGPVPDRRARALLDRRRIPPERRDTSDHRQRIEERVRAGSRVERDVRLERGMRSDSRGRDVAERVPTRAARSERETGGAESRPSEERRSGQDPEMKRAAARAVRQYSTQGSERAQRSDSPPRRDSVRDQACEQGVSTRRDLCGRNQESRSKPRVADEHRQPRDNSRQSHSKRDAIERQEERVRSRSRRDTDERRQDQGRNRCETDERRHAGDQARYSRGRRDADERRQDQDRSRRETDERRQADDRGRHSRSRHEKDRGRSRRDTDDRRHDRDCGRRSQSRRNTDERRQEKDRGRHSHSRRDTDDRRHEKDRGRRSHSKRNTDERRQERDRGRHSRSRRDTDERRRADAQRRSRRRSADHQKTQGRRSRSGGRDLGRQERERSRQERDRRSRERDDRRR